MGTVFLNTPAVTSAYFSRGGILFLSVILSGSSIFIIAEDIVRPQGSFICSYNDLA